jgi:alkylated DNA nucleotide flippase Atl1
MLQQMLKPLFVAKSRPVKHCGYRCASSGGAIVMAKARKSWAQKLEDARAKTADPRKVHCEKTGQWLLIPPVTEIEDLMRGVYPGRLMSMKQITDLLAERHQVDFCCPMTTGIFAWIIAHATEDQPDQDPVLPWWRIVKAGGELNPKLPGGGAIQQKRLEDEGHRVVTKGKRLVVADYERALVEPNGN